jgi:SpoVK/Ycf46/Vps4 family AAA+-type ATPase
LTATRFHHTSTLSLTTPPPYQKVRALFAVAGAMQPSVVFIDEVDSILSARRAEGECVCVCVRRGGGGAVCVHTDTAFFRCARARVSEGVAAALSRHQRATQDDTTKPTDQHSTLNDANKKASTRRRAASRPSCSCRWRAATRAAPSAACCSSARPTGQR